jgi:hypothetical protein
MFNRRPEIIVSAKQSQDSAGRAKQGLMAVDVQTVAMVSMALKGVTVAAQRIELNLPFVSLCERRRKEAEMK